MPKIVDIYSYPGQAIHRPDYNRLHFDSGFSDIVGLYTAVADYTGEISPAEANLVASSIVKRRREFSSGRWLTRKGLDLLGLEASPILAGDKRQPLWPEGIVGSIAHSDSHAVVAIARSERYRGIGLDLEKIGAVDDTLLPKLLTPKEQFENSGLDSTLIFSAKESVYKFLFPLFGKYVDFQEVEISIQHDRNQFSTKYLGETRAHNIIEQATGLFMPLEGHWLTLIKLEIA